VALLKGTGLMYDGETRDGWHAVLYRGKRHWVSSRYSEIAVLPKHIVDLSAYDDVRDWDAFCANVSYVWLRVGLRSLTSAGTIKNDAKFYRHASELTRPRRAVRRVFTPRQNRRGRG
jgi:GH25 family lysozyme M1 (1,4-beta-N-acetylmuramidase)